MDLILNYKVLLAIVGVLIIFVGELVYIKDIFKNGARPHPFTWFGWAMATGIVAYAQVWDGSGLAFAVLGVESIMTFFIGILGLFYSKVKFYFTDFLAFATGIGAMILWYFLQTPLWSVFLITFADVLMFIPTIRKTFEDPFSESLFEYYTSSAAYFVSFFALTNLSLITFFYPGVLIILNGIFIIFALAARATFKNMKDTKINIFSEEVIFKETLKSAKAKSGKIYIFEKYSLREMIGQEKTKIIREEISKNNIEVFQISNYNEKELKKKNPEASNDYLEKNIKFKYIPKSIFEIKKEMMVYDDTVVVYDNDKTNKITLIKDEDMAEMNKKLFLNLWNNN